MASSGDVIFLDEMESVRAEAARLKAEGVNIIVLLSHSGYDVDQVLAENITDLDVIVGGHTHSFLYTGLSVSLIPPFTLTPSLSRKTMFTIKCANIFFLIIL
jgi:predicted phosphodiesterase